MHSSSVTYLGCLQSVLFDRARRQAKELDNEFASTKRLRGPLHGVPVSFKDQCPSNYRDLEHSTLIFTGITVDMVDVDTTLGFTQWSNKPSTRDADVSRIF